MMTAMALTYDVPLSSLLEGFASVSPEFDLEITGITIDSRKIKTGDLFFACHCKYSNSIQFIKEAISAGACAIVAESDCLPEDADYNIPLFSVADLHSKIGIIAARFYGQPSRDMTVIGVTGTDGKTSVSYLLAQALSTGQKHTAGFIGTLGYGSVDNLEPGPNTTPDPITLQRLLADMKDQGISTVVMEVSSHGLDQYRVVGVDFDLAIFTNLGRDHLDYHNDIEDYSNTKQSFFTEYSIGKVVINLDDDVGGLILNKLGNNIQAVTYTIVNDLNLHLDTSFQTVAGKMDINPSGKMILELKTPWGEGYLETNFVGKFNAYNLMACLTSL
ncbi:MAG: UDP-N-acetylmuramyl-tripeptide synthetase, partial [Gammaproteobacteria bacterium]